MISNISSYPIFLDYQSTTPMDKRALAQMLPWFSDNFGNPHSAEHKHGWDASDAVERARAQVAKLIGANKREIIFTSGATESNNLAIKGCARARKRKDGRNKIITLASEHKCVLESADSLRSEGFEITILPVKIDGLLDLNILRDAIDKNTALVSIMAVNNEIGVIQPLAEIGAICKEMDVYFHSDCAQAVGKITLDMRAMNLDLISISAHKLYGPKAIGALYINRKTRIAIDHLMDGGGQERGLRSGTLSPALCVGFGAACQISNIEMVNEAGRLKELRDRFLSILQAQLPDIIINGSITKRVAGNLNLTFNGIDTSELMASLTGLSISSGSACSSDNSKHSHVLKAIGHDPAVVAASLRIGFGRFTGDDEILNGANQIITAIKKLQS